jgi:hypothetical protein
LSSHISFSYLTVVFTLVISILPRVATTPSGPLVDILIRFGRPL